MEDTSPAVIGVEDLLLGSGTVDVKLYGGKVVQKNKIDSNAIPYDSTRSIHEVLDAIDKTITGGVVSDLDKAAKALNDVKLSMPKIITLTHSIPEIEKLAKHISEVQLLSHRIDDIDSVMSELKALKNFEAQVQYLLTVQNTVNYKARVTLNSMTKYCNECLKPILDQLSEERKTLGIIVADLAKANAKGGEVAKKLQDYTWTVEYCNSCIQPKFEFRDTAKTITLVLPTPPKVGQREVVQTVTDSDAQKSASARLSNMLYAYIMSLNGVVGASNIKTDDPTSIKPHLGTLQEHVDKDTHLPVRIIPPNSTIKEALSVLNVLLGQIADTDFIDKIGELKDVQDDLTTHHEELLYVTKAGKVETFVLNANTIPYTPDSALFNAVCTPCTVKKALDHLFKGASESDEEIADISKAVTKNLANIKTNTDNLKITNDRAIDNSNKVKVNTDNIKINTSQIQINKDDIKDLDTKVINNKKDININHTDILKNTADIKANKKVYDDNKVLTDEEIDKKLYIKDFTFLNLPDTINTFTGHDGKALIVKGGKVDVLDLIANNIKYDDLISKLGADNVQDALVKLKALLDKQPDQLYVATLADLPSVADEHTVCIVEDASADPSVKQGWGKYWYLNGKWRLFLCKDDVDIVALTTVQAIDKASKAQGTISGENLYKLLVANQSKLGDIVKGTETLPKINTPKQLHDEIREIERKYTLQLFDLEETNYGSGAGQVHYVLGAGGRIYKALKANTPKGSTPETTPAEWELVHRPIRFFATMAEAEAEDIEQNQVFIVGNALAGTYKGTYINVRAKQKFTLTKPTGVQRVGVDTDKAFISMTDVKAKILKRPTTAEVQAYLDTLAPKLVDKVLYYTGTDTDTDEVIATFYVGQDTKVVKLSGGTEGRWGEPVATVADLVALDARDDEHRTVLATETGYIFKKNDRLSPDEKKDLRNIPDKAGTGLWVAPEHGVLVDFNFQLGQVVHTEPDDSKATYQINGRTVEDAKLAEYLMLHPRKGFVVKGIKITLPDWRGRYLGATGALGISEEVGSILASSNKRHTHAIPTQHNEAYSGSLTVGGGGSSGTYYTKPEGQQYARPETAGMPLCIIGGRVMEMLIPADSRIAEEVLFKVTGDVTTFNGGKTVAKLYEGVSSYRFKLDIPEGKEVDTISAGTIVDDRTGEIVVSQDVGLGDLTVTVTLKDKNTSLNPFNEVLRIMGRRWKAFQPPRSGMYRVTFSGTAWAKQSKLLRLMYEYKEDEALRLSLGVDLYVSSTYKHVAFPVMARTIYMDKNKTYTFRQAPVYNTGLVVDDNDRLNLSIEEIL